MLYIISIHYSFLTILPLDIRSLLSKFHPNRMSRLAVTSIGSLLFHLVISTKVCDLTVAQKC